MPFCQAKYFVLSLLVVQNTCFVLLMRYSRTRPGTMYLSSTAVCCDEALKLVTCLGILVFTYLCQKRRNKGESSAGKDGSGDYSRLSVRQEDITNDVSCCVPIGVPIEGSDEESVSIVQNANNGINMTKTTQQQKQTMIRGVSSVVNESEIDIIQQAQHNSFRSYLKEQLQFDIRVAVIAGLFTVQKNLLYLAISNLDAAVFQVTYQAKVLTTAVFSVLLLKRKLSAPQIVALILLTVGVALVQLDKVEDKSGGVGSYQEQNHWVGLAAVLGACCTSGFGGVYFELVLKPKPNGEEDGSTPTRPPPSVWAKNVQLSAFGFLIALFTAFAKDHAAISNGGFFQGYSPLVLTVIALQSGGGLIVAAIIKYADNILKSFATGASIVTSTLVSEWLFGFSVTEMFAWGCMLQFVAIWLYSKKGNEGGVGGSCCSRETTSECKLPVQTSEDIDMISSGGGNVEIRKFRKH